jgi:hypothetical protein
MAASSETDEASALRLGMMGSTVLTMKEDPRWA